MNETVVEYVDDAESSTGVQVVDGDSNADMASIAGRSMVSMAGISDGNDSMIKINASMSQRSGSMYSGSDV